MEKEQVIVLHEEEACIVWEAVRKYLTDRKWDVTDEEDWSMLVNTKTIEEKIRKYLDHGEGEDVIER